MIEKIRYAIKNISHSALMLMFYGTRLALGVLIIGIIAHLYNEYILNGRYINTLFCITVIQAAFSLFVQFIIGGLIFDCANMKK